MPQCASSANKKTGRDLDRCHTPIFYWHKAFRATLARAAVPPAVLTPRCDGCSLRGVCLPEATTSPSRRARLFEPRDY